MDFLDETTSFQGDPFVAGSDAADTGTDGNSVGWAIFAIVTPFILYDPSG